MAVAAKMEIVFPVVSAVVVTLILTVSVPYLNALTITCEIFMLEKLKVMLPTAEEDPNFKFLAVGISLPKIFVPETEVKAMSLVKYVFLLVSIDEDKSVPIFAHAKSLTVMSYSACEPMGF